MPQEPRPAKRKKRTPARKTRKRARGGGSDPEKRKLAEELARTRARLAEVEAENRRVSDEFVAAQERTTGLAQLYVALERIHGGASRAETLAAVQEIVINMVGCEELAIFERRGDTLHLVKSFGVTLRDLHPVGQGALGRAVEKGQVYIARRDGPPSEDEEELTAVIPLRVGAEIAGAIALFRLLGHKTGIVKSDQAVFDLLSAHAGLALHLRAAPGEPAVG